MTKEIEILSIENRIEILSARPKDNGRVIQKLKREYKLLTGQEYAAAGTENA